MKLGRSTRSFILAAIVASGVLTGCGTNPPPAKELALEVVETAKDSNGNDLSDSVKQCMREAINEFTLTDEQAKAFKDFDDVVAKADNGNEVAKGVLVEFEAALASCN